MLLKVLDHPSVGGLKFAAASTTHLYEVMEIYENAIGGVKVDAEGQIRVKTKNDTAASKNDSEEDIVIAYDRFVGDFLDAIVYLHSECIAHRDLKPENIMLYWNTDNENDDDDDDDDGDGDDDDDDDDGNKVGLKVIDFGLAVDNCAAQKNKCEEFFERMVGSRYYMAPEMSNCDGKSGYQVDVWSAGVILYELATGKFPIFVDETGNKASKYAPTYTANNDKSAFERKLGQFLALPVC